MYKYKLKEIEVGDTEIRKGVKSTVTDIDPETGAIEWDVASAADFSSTYKALQQAREFLDDLDKKAEQTKMDPAIDKFAADIADLFNSFRSHIRKNYPEEYERVLRLKEQSSTATGGDAFAGGEGAQYATPFAFRKKGKKSPSIYYYKLGYKPVPKKIKGSGIIVKQLFETSDRNKFQSKRIAAFKEIEERLNRIYPLLDNAKDETAKYYNENPGSYAVVYSTDYIFELLDEVEAKLNRTE
jgi:hypothetical protein